MRNIAYPRRQLRALRSEWIGKNRWVVLGWGAANLVIAAIVTFLLTRQPTWLSWYLFGAFHVGVAVAIAWPLNTLFIAHHNKAIHQLRGAFGEENTRDELKRARRKRLVWDWVDSVTLAAGDLDHFVVPRCGDLVVLDSKWRSDASKGVTQDLIDGARRSRLRAEALARTLLDAERGVRHRQRTNPLRVRSAVVVWGALQQNVEPQLAVDGVDVVAGRHLCSWLASLEGEAIPEDAARDLIDRVQAFRAGTDTTTKRVARPQRRPA